MDNFSSKIDSLIKKIKRLGSFTNSELASDYHEDIHGEELNALLVYLGQTFPIPVLEKAVKVYREKLSIAKKEIRDEMFMLGTNLNEISFDDKVISVELEINVKVNDKERLNKFMADHGYESFIKNEYSFQKGLDTSEIDMLLADHGYFYEKNTSIHHKSLNKILKEIVLTGGELPESSIADIKPYDNVVIKTKNR